MIKRTIIVMGVFLVMNAHVALAVAKKAPGALILTAKATTTVVRKAELSQTKVFEIHADLVNGTKQPIDFGYEDICVDHNWSVDNPSVALFPCVARKNIGSQVVNVAAGETFSMVVKININPRTPPGPLRFRLTLHSVPPMRGKLKTVFENMTTNEIEMNIVE